MKKLNVKRKMTTYRKSNPKKFTVVLILLILILGVFTYFLLSYLGLFGAAPRTGYATVKVLDIGEDNEDVSDEAEVTVYDVNIVGLDADDLTKLDYDDYDVLVEETEAENVNFFIDENHIYKMKVEYKDSVRWYTPDPGENIVMMVEETDTLNIIIRDDENYNSTILGNTELDYGMEVICDESDEGLMPGYLLNEDDVNLIWYCFNFSRTAQEDFAKIDDYHNEKIANSTMLFIGVTGLVVDKVEYDVTLGSGKTTTYDCNNYGWFFGIEDEINPTWIL